MNFTHYANTAREFLQLPPVQQAIGAWTVAFTIPFTLGTWLGFGPAGIVAGSYAAAFQSAIYGAATPAGGIFASLTSLGMLGQLSTALAGVSAIFATVTASIAYYFGRG